MANEEKIYKPLTCEQCPAIKNEKGTLICGVMRELKAKAHDTQGKLEMWEKCPIDWDKEKIKKI